MKKLFSLTLAMFVLALTTVLARPALALDDRKFEQPFSIQRVPQTNLEFVGKEHAGTSYSGTATSGQLVFSGKGVLYDVALGTAATGTYLVCNDSATANSTDDSGAGNLFPPIYVSSTATSIQVQSAALFLPNAFPISITNGLNCWTSAAMGFEAYYRKNTANGN